MIPQFESWVGEEELENFYNHLFSTSSTFIRGFDARFLHLVELKPGQKLLDIGCGAGELLAVAERNRLQCWGVDISRVAIERAKQRAPNAVFAKANVDVSLPFQSEQFDYITAIGILEHIKNQDSLIKEICRVARPSSLICILVPNRDFLPHKLVYRANRHALDQPIETKFSFKEWQELLQSNGLLVKCVHKDNTILENIRGTRMRYMLAKVLLRPFLKLIPLRLSWCIIFLCMPRSSSVP